MTSQKNELLEKARIAQKNSYSPYSKFSVGTALLTKNGEIFTGCNIENVSYGLSICAERTALFKAVSDGHQEFIAMAISTSSNKPTFPCGACRQVISEFGNIEIYLENDEKTYSVFDLLPFSFSKKHLV